MLRFILRVLHFSGIYAKQLKLSFILSFLESMLYNTPVLLTVLMFTQAMEHSLEFRHIAYYAGGILAALLICCILKRLFVQLESGTGYQVCAEERLSVGERLKQLPMGYFGEGTIGNIISAITFDLLFVEEHGMAALDKVINGYCGILSSCIMLFFVDRVVALTALAVTCVAMVVLEWVQRVGSEQSAIRQKQSAELTDAVLEYIHGISVVKSLNLSADRAKRIRATIKDSCNKALTFEVKFMQPNTCYQLCFSVGMALMIFVTLLRCINGQISLPTTMMLLIYVFFIFSPIQALGSMSSQIRIMEACLDRYEAIKQIPRITEGSQTELTQFKIEFEDVEFSYGTDVVLDHVSFCVPERSVTALVGPSGAGKSTIANLIMRLWDVQKGTVCIGGIDVRDLTTDALLSHISTVFQKVYLFNDTIENNIRFGNPHATHEEIIEAARKARCHDFILNLPEGYKTVVGEGGSTLSGGERQRISIARAILKNAPIVILDEATASIDPENEHLIQQAISELTMGKTVLVIAHRLATIEHADQILVVDQGRIVQKGTHQKLICQNGLYRRFIEIRERAEGWSIA